MCFEGLFFVNTITKSKNNNSFNFIVFSYFQASVYKDFTTPAQQKMNYASENLLSSVEKNLKESGMKFETFGVASRPAHINKSESPQIKTQDIQENEKSSTRDHESEQFSYTHINHANRPISHFETYNQQQYPHHTLNSNYHETMESEPKQINPMFYPPFYHAMYPPPTNYITNSSGVSPYHHLQQQQPPQKPEDHTTREDVKVKMDADEQNRVNMTKKVLEEKIKEKTKKKNKSYSKSSNSSEWGISKDGTKDSKAKQSGKKSLFKKCVDRFRNPFVRENTIFVLVIVVVCVILIAFIAMFAIEVYGRSIRLNQSSIDINKSEDDSFCPQQPETHSIMKPSRNEPISLNNANPPQPVQQRQPINYASDVQLQREDQTEDNGAPLEKPKNHVRFQIRNNGARENTPQQIKSPVPHELNPEQQIETSQPQLNHVPLHTFSKSSESNDSFVN